jgi:hypothetical protein
MSWRRVRLPSPGLAFLVAGCNSPGALTCSTSSRRHQTIDCGHHDLSTPSDTRSSCLDHQCTAIQPQLCNQALDRAVRTSILGLSKVSCRPVRRIAITTARLTSFTLINSAQIGPDLPNHGGPAGALRASQRRRWWQPKPATATAASAALPTALGVVAALLPLTQWPAAAPPLCHHVAQHVGRKHACA